MPPLTLISGGGTVLGRSILAADDFSNLCSFCKLSAKWAKIELGLIGRNRQQAKTKLRDC
jgi:hypothetical protein